jgi:hypothetical protein
MNGERILDVLIEILGTLVPAVAILTILALMYRAKEDKNE